jgi:tetratricopeptide (TPR) repeat protein
MKTITLKSLYFIVLIVVGGLFYMANGQKKKSIDSLQTPKIVLDKRGNAAYNEDRYSLAADYYKKQLMALPLPVVPVQLWLRLADCYWHLRKLDDCMKTYDGLLAYNQPELTPTDKIRLSELYARKGRYDEANKWLKEVPNYEKKAEAYIDMQQQIPMYKDSDCWKIELLKVNPGYRMFAPALLDSIFFFSSNCPIASKEGLSDGVQSDYSHLWQADLSSAKREIDENLKANAPAVLNPMKMVKKELVKKRLANVYEMSDVAVAQREKYIYRVKQIITLFDGKPIRGMDKDIYNSLTIAMDSGMNVYFAAENENDKKFHLKQGFYNGKEVKEVHDINIPGWTENCSTMFPAINQAGTILIFSSDRGGGRGGYDLYVSTRKNKNSPWCTPYSLSSVNTIGNEVYPSITSDGYLYFSSDGRPGLGGVDIYRIGLIDAINQKDNVEHLSYPINSSANDYGWAQYRDGVSGFFSSDRQDCTDNIYNFQCTPKVTVSGFVKNKLTDIPVNNAIVFVYDKSAGKVHVLRTNQQGKYTLPIRKGSDLALRVVINPYDKVILNNVTNEMSPCRFIHITDNGLLINDLFVNRVSIGTSWAMDTIFYGFNKWDIKQASYPSLDKVVALLAAYPLLHVEISAYTDNRGSIEYNLLLSDRRAKTLVDYIEKQGIESTRIKAKGYGKTHFVNNLRKGALYCEKLHQMNRRAEIRVTGFENVPDTSGRQIPDLTKYKEGDLLDPNTLPKGFFEQDTDKTTVPLLPAEAMQNAETTFTGDSHVASETDKKLQIAAMPEAKQKYSAIALPDSSGIQKINGEYVIQVAVSKSLKNATRLSDKIKTGLPDNVYSFVSEDSNHTTYSVKIGYFKSYDKALEVMKTIHSRAETIVR